jgi:hypothetical protein
LVRVTHPFHPLSGRALVFVARLRCWRGDIVYYLDDQGRRQRIQAAWTDVVPDDAFRVVAAGRCAFRTEDLLAVAGLVDRLRAGGTGQDVDLVGEIVP